MASIFVLAISLALVSKSIATAPIYEGQILKWQNCPASLGFLQHTIECAEVQVPLDYNTPGKAGNVTIGIARLPALQPRDRIGNLFYNPGGPGDSATEALNTSALAKNAWHPKIRDRFDIIGVDLRGTALSSPILYDQDLFVQRVSELPTDTDEFEALVAKNVALRQSSIELTGTPLIDYMDTATLAQDHEVVRSALGDEKLSWLGQSGGTQLGTQYAELYPSNIRAMVLDAVVARSQVGTPGFVENAVSEDAVIRQFFKWCEQQNATSCPLAHQNQTAEAIWSSLVTQAQSSPLPAPGCTPKTCVNNNVTADDLRNVARLFLYKPHFAGKGFAAFAAGIYEVVVHNDATGVAQAVLTIPNNSTPPFVTAVNYATNVIQCNDRINDDTLVSMRAKSLEGETSTPLFGGVTSEAAFESACVGWPTLDRNPPHAVAIDFGNTTMPVILMVSNLYDPATPYSWGTMVQQEIGDEHARRVTRKAAGHTIYFQPEAFDGETVRAMNDYLLDLKLPDRMPSLSRKALPKRRRGRVVLGCLAW